jgi:6-phosphogluconolactonase (cycloisomerase 2 family)
MYTIHEMGNTVTQHTIAPLSSGVTATPLVANVSILPPDLPANSKMGAAELLRASSPTPLLYASNRNLDLNATNIGAGDTITILRTTPALQPVGYVKTGLAQIRAMAFLGDNDQYLLAAGLVGGGVKVYERVSEEQGWLKEVASLKDTRVGQPTSFVSV